MFVPQPLKDEYKVDKTVVSCHHNLPERLAGKESAYQVRQVTETPLCQEEEAQAGGGADLVVLVYLRKLGKKPGEDAADAEDC